MTAPRLNKPLLLLLLAGFVSALLTESRGANRHPCALGPVEKGILVAGTSLMVQVKGAEKPFRLEGIADVSQLPDRWTGQKVRLYLTTAKPDRYNRLKAQVFLTGKQQEWLQGTLLTSGNARYSGESTHPACIEAMRLAEHEARRSETGLWNGNPTMLDATKPSTIEKQAGAFAIVTGRVMSVGDRRRRLYLNFGKKWSEDFTVQAAKQGRNSFQGSIGSLKALKGKRVTVRGMVALSGGPVIRLLQVGQLEIHDD